MVTVGSFEYPMTNSTNSNKVKLIKIILFTSVISHADPLQYHPILAKLFCDDVFCANRALT